MKILILDDDENRHRLFARNLIGFEVEHVTTAENAIKSLGVSDYDAVFLDHDLGGEIYVSSFGDITTGYTVAKWLEENPQHKPAQIYIHSFNPAGAKNMNACLPEAELVPGVWSSPLIKNLLKEKG